MVVTFINNAGFVSSFAVKWPGGESGRTKVIAIHETATIDMANTSAPAGASCWAIAYIQGGANHESGQNFTLGSDNVTYRITGSTIQPSFSLS